MSHLKIGLRIECLRLPVRKALRNAAELGVQGVQLNAVGDLAPDNLTATGRRELLHLLNSVGLTLTALGFPTRHGYNTEDGLDARITAVQKVLTLSYELRAPIVTGAIGRIPEDETHPARKTLTEAMTEIGRHADRVGAVFAAETGTESGATLRRFIDSLGGIGLRTNVDPASLLVKGYDPIQAVRDLNTMIVHTHARDAVREAGGELGREATPGDGDLDWNEYLGALEEVGYRGWFVIEREQTDNPERECARAVDFLRQF
jgi:sugar phosphate isomerase/epimerase